MNKVNFNSLTRKFLNTKLKLSNKSSLVLNLKSKSYDEYINMSNIVSQNFKTRWSSQIYHSENYYQGLIEFEKRSDFIVEVEKLSRLINNNKQGEVYSQIEQIEKLEQRESLYNKFKENKFKCSMFNRNNKLGGLIHCNIYFTGDGISDFYDMRHENYGRFIEKLEYYQNNYEIIEMQSVPDTDLSDPIVEQSRLERMITLIRDNNSICDKLIAIRSNNIDTIQKMLEKGADIICDPTGGCSDLNILRVVKNYNVPFILNFDLFHINKELSFYSNFITNLDKKINYLIGKGLMNHQIAINLNLNTLGKNQLIEFYKNLKDFRDKFDNIIISPFAVPEQISNADEIIELLFKNNFNLIRYFNFQHMKRIIPLLRNDMGSELGFTPIKSRYSEPKSLSDIPIYPFISEKKDEDWDKKLFDLTKVKKKDELLNIIQKTKDNS